MKRPSFAVAWAASQRIYDPANSGARVAKVIGGYVEKNVNNPDPTQRWSNTCAVRMSYILGEAGMVMPRIPGQTVSGGDDRQYFFRVRDLIRLLEQRWGKAGNVPQTVEGWDGGCGIDYATLRSWSMLDFEGERFRA
ncbi:type VI secretion system amidase effector protein Tae4, partial [Burkholderia contaminans]|uniref:type VI secretion system amidase effector protein Tae4 n=1 Tax=Burkholderia contaminans TaxID=488447 RepID=UPI0021BC1522